MSDNSIAPVSNSSAAALGGSLGITRDPFGGNAAGAPTDAPPTLPSDGRVGFFAPQYAGGAQRAEELINWAAGYVQAYAEQSSPPGTPVVMHAIDLLHRQYMAATTPDEAARLTELGTRLVQAGVQAGLLPSNPRALEALFAGQLWRPTPAVRLPDAVAAPVTPPAPLPTTAPTGGTPRLELDTRPFVGPTLDGRVGGEHFAGFRVVLDGEGGRNPSWKRPSELSVQELSVGVTTPGFRVDPNGTIDVVRPEVRAAYYKADGRGESLLLRAGFEIEPNQAGRHPVGVGATYINARPDSPVTRVDAQVKTPEAPGAQWAWSSRLEQDVLRVGPDVVRLRAGAWSSGRSGEATGFSGALTLNPAPDPGLFPKDGSPTRLSLGLQAAVTPAPVTGNAGRTLTSLGGSIEVNSPQYRVGAALTHRHAPASTKGGFDMSELRLDVNAQARIGGLLGLKDSGQPPTDLAGISQDMPTGEWPAGQQGTNTTVYGSLRQTLSSSDPAPANAPWGAGDAARLGIIHARSAGLVSAASLELRADFDQGGVGAEASVWLHPVEQVPAFLHLNAETNPDRTVVGVGIGVMPDPKSVIEIGVEHVDEAGPGAADSNNVYLRAGFRF